MARSTYFDLGRSADACPGSESGYAQRFQCGNIVKRRIWTRMQCNSLLNERTYGCLTNLRFSTRMEADPDALKKSIGNGRLKDRYKMERRLGRIQARNPQVNDLFEVSLQDTPVGVR